MLNRITMAFKKKEDTTWYDLHTLCVYEYVSALLQQKFGGSPDDCKNDFFIDVVVWSGKRAVDFTAKNMLAGDQVLMRAFTYHKTNDFK